MKLKKIASLALAGIMAVSMLAGCKDGGSSSSSSSEPTTSATGVASGANAERSDYFKNTLGISYNEDTTLQNLLTTAAQAEFKTADIKGVAASYDTKFGVVTPVYAAGQGTGAGLKVTNKIFQGLTGVNATNNTFNFALSSATAGDVRKGVVLFAVGGSYDADDAGALVSRYMNTNWFTSSAAATYLPVTGTGTGSSAVSATYSADIAATKVVSAEDASTNIWLVAVAFTQTVSSAKV